MKYFGTSTSEAGHFYWDISERMKCEGLRSDCPFEPEGLFKSHVKKGTTSFMQVDGWTVFAICGSPIDSRPGSKSVFFINELVAKDELIERIRQNSVAMQIISKMNFIVKY